MKKILLPLAASFAFITPAAHAEDLLTGDTRLACEAILCLSSGERPSECSPSLRRYFGISHRKLSDTIKARRNFLKLCPTASDSASNMPSLVNAIAEGAGRCDAEFLNRQNRICSRDEYGRSCTVLPIIPNYCKAYSSHEYTYKVDLPNYVCTRTTRKLDNKGKWQTRCKQGHFVDAK